MWVQYKSKLDDRLKKFQFSKGDTLPLSLNIEGEDWHLDDPKHGFSFFPTKKPEICNLENMKLIGVAELRKDDITGLKLWATFNNEGGEHINLSPSQPLIIPAEGKLQLGTKIGFYAPKD